MTPGTDNRAKLILARLHPDGDDSGEGLKSAAEDILAAVKTDDPGALVKALCGFVDQYEPGEPPDEEPAGEEGAA
jgi:hypothetical protein